MRMAIIGGGIAGLVAAMSSSGRVRRIPLVQYTLFEARERLAARGQRDRPGHGSAAWPGLVPYREAGGIHAVPRTGTRPNSLPSNDVYRKTYILVGNQLVPLLDGLMFLAPTKLVPTALSPSFSFPTKARMALELLLPPRRRRNTDESVASLVTRHFGTEAVDRLADPLLSGIYGGDAAQLSAKTVLPRLVESETQYGSLTRGTLAAHRKMRARAAANGHGDPAADARLHHPPRGMQQLVDAIRARLDWAAVRFLSLVMRLERAPNGWMVHSLGTAEFYDSVIVASPAGCRRRRWLPSMRCSANNWAAFLTRPRLPSTSSTTRMRWASFPRASASWFLPASVARCWPALLPTASFSAAPLPARP